MAYLTWTKNLLHKLHIPLETKPTFWRDNIRAAHMASNLVQYAHSKYVGLEWREW